MLNKLILPYAKSKMKSSLSKNIINLHLSKKFFLSSLRKNISMINALNSIVIENYNDNSSTNSSNGENQLFLSEREAKLIEQRKNDLYNFLESFRGELEFVPVETSNKNVTTNSTCNESNINSTAPKRKFKPPHFSEKINYDLKSFILSNIIRKTQYRCK